MILIYNLPVCRAGAYNSANLKPQSHSYLLIGAMFSVCLNTCNIWRNCDISVRRQVLWPLKSVAAATRLLAMQSVSAATRLPAMQSVSAVIRLTAMQSVAAATRLPAMHSVAAATRLPAMQTVSAATHLPAMQSVAAATRLPAMLSVAAATRLPVMQWVAAATRLPATRKEWQQEMPVQVKEFFLKSELLFTSVRVMSDMAPECNPHPYQP